MGGDVLIWIVFMAVVVWAVSKIEKAERRGRMGVGGILLLIALAGWLLFLIFASAGCAVAAVPRNADGVSGALIRLVGATGFEPATTCTPSKCATRLRHAPT